MRSAAAPFCPQENTAESLTGLLWRIDPGSLDCLAIPACGQTQLVETDVRDRHRKPACRGVCVEEPLEYPVHLEGPARPAGDDGQFVRGAAPEGVFPFDEGGQGFRPRQDGNGSP